MIGRGESKAVVHAQYDFRHDSIDVFMAARSDRSGELWVAQPLVYMQTPEGARSDPTMRLPREDAQALMDQLWNCGIRPAEGAGSAGQMGAVERHLKDMRAIAFGMLSPRVEKP